MKTLRRMWCRIRGHHKFVGQWESFPDGQGYVYKCACGQYARIVVT